MHTADHRFAPVRTDPLTGVGNLISFADLLLAGQAMAEPRSLIALDLKGLSKFERSQGDQALRWVALVLGEELSVPVFRIGSDEFVALLAGNDHAAHRHRAELLARRLDQEAGRLGLTAPVVTVGVLHYRGDERHSPADLLGQIHAALQAARKGGDAPVTALAAASIGDDLDLYQVTNLLVQRLVGLGNLLEVSQQLASTDPVTGLPNMRAALEQIEDALGQSVSKQQPFGLLMIDGDNLRRYNEIGYAAGDRMLIDLASTLREQLRPSDFLARWRIGDEFLVLLPKTGVSGSAALAERLRRRVVDVSQYWPFPVTISVGIASYPQHGQSAQGLLDQAEEAKQRAKAAGKNCVVVAEPRVEG